MCNIVLLSVYKASGDPEQWKEVSKRPEKEAIGGLFNKSPWTVVYEKDISAGPNVLEGRFVPALNDLWVPDKILKKSLFVQG